MPQFILDTSGEVGGLQIGGLSNLARGYIEALFFTETEGSIEAGTFDPENGSALPVEAGFDSLAPATLARIVADCAAFEASPAWQAFEGSDAWFDIEEAQAGRDLWFTRNGHGVGFWDGDWPEPHATALDTAAKALGEVSVYWGDDQKTHIG